MARNNRKGLALGSLRLLRSFAFCAGGVQKGSLGAPLRLLGAPLRLFGAPLRLLGSFSRAHKEALCRTREALGMLRFLAYIDVFSPLRLLGLPFTLIEFAPFRPLRLLGSPLRLLGFCSATHCSSCGPSVLKLCFLLFFVSFRSSYSLYGILTIFGRSLRLLSSLRLLGAVEYVKFYFKLR